MSGYILAWFVMKPANVVNNNCAIDREHSRKPEISVCVRAGAGAEGGGTCPCAMPSSATELFPTKPFMHGYDNITTLHNLQFCKSH